MFRKLAFAAVAALLFVASCGGGGGGGNSYYPYGGGGTPTLSGRWTFTDTVTQDPYGLFGGVGYVTTDSGYITQTGSTFTVQWDSGGTSTGTLNGQNFTLTSTIPTDLAGDSWLLSDYASGTATSSSMSGTGYDRSTLVSGSDPNGMNGGIVLRYSFTAY